MSDQRQVFLLWLCGASVVLLLCVGMVGCSSQSPAPPSPGTAIPSVTPPSPTVGSLERVAVSSVGLSVSWTPTSANTDCSVLTDLAYYDVVDAHGVAAVSLGRVGASQLFFALPALVPGRHVLEVVAVNTSGTRSAMSPSVSLEVLP